MGSPGKWQSQETLRSTSTMQNCTLHLPTKREEMCHNQWLVKPHTRTSSAVTRSSSVARSAFSAATSSCSRATCAWAAAVLAASSLARAPLVDSAVCACFSSLYLG